ncbi:DEAD/DEAH box helicase [Pectinatus frisingensis]|uniref:DEAD/DEAH box helicase n=1 Tax=Pectinatus frisingensis TaxID=865 RepID=UPI0018C51874|nr:DEAD/DEAH box helicase [Pectinatus frisingensis]
MSNKVLINKIHEKMANIPESQNSIIVLKGISMSIVDVNCKVKKLEEVIKDKFSYFMQIYSKRKYITYEEFLMLNNFILEQYEVVYIFNNNLYMNQYPIEANFSDEVKNGLLTHFTESENDNDDSYIGSIDEIIDIYDGIKEYNGYLIGAYCNDKILDNNKIRQIDLFEYSNIVIQSVESANGDTVLELEDESDYIDLVKKVFYEPDKIYIRTTNYTGDVEQLNYHISVLCNNIADCTDIYYIQAQQIKSTFEHRDDYTTILKQYWGHDNFRQFDVYDLNKLTNKSKETIKVSQEQIISDLVQQVENCGDPDKTYRDVFVTAPTGAGKSVIFQVPAIYLAEKYNFLTIVVSPLIGLMNDQVNNLEKKNYKDAKTINSDISPIVKEEILEKVAESKYHILYLSPETLLARSDVEQLIGNRTIGMIIIDEAHIVTTWGKQFRPDYWYLGEHIRKLRSNQIKKKGRSFVIGTFTATAIYHGIEDMYEETKNSLHMVDPITYIGYIKRNDINIVIDTDKVANGARTEYETDKFDQIEQVIKRAVITGKKTLIYFPTVTLIERCYQYIENKHMISYVAKYYGPLPKDQKDENYQMFYSGDKLVMLATKAFGMGIDIDNIELVIHFAPTGNVCDYVQEIGRAARRYDLHGEAYYHYNSRDFKYINRLHGLSTIKKYQLIEVVKKIYELFKINRNQYSDVRTTKRKNAMLLDAENFTYIFDNPVNDGDDNINKVKTALLIIQKDFEGKIGFSPINVRPIPLFSIGYFSIEPIVQKKLLQEYRGCTKEIDEENHICSVNLESIWDKDYKDKSFPQFKFLVYSRDKKLKFNQSYTISPALCVKIVFLNDYVSSFKKVWMNLKKIAHDGIVLQKYISTDEFIKVLEDRCKIRKYKAHAICEVLFASMDIYRKNFSHNTNSIFQKKELNSGEVKYQFKDAINTYFKWVEHGFESIVKGTKNGELYIINSTGKQAREYNTILGILESLNILTFKMAGGVNSQLYIYINQVRNLKNIVNNPGAYKNRLLDIVSERHLISVKMLTYIYEGKFSNEKIWDILEDYFLGEIPEKVKINCKKENPDIVFNV